MTRPAITARHLLRRTPASGLATASGLLPLSAQAADSPFLQWLGTPATVANWQLLALVLLALAGPVWLGLVLFRRLGPAWRRYREDHFLGMHWRWHYKGGQPEDIRCYCPQDDTQLTYHYSQTDNEVRFHCETCDRIYGSFAGDAAYVRGVIRRQIQRKLRTGEWQTPGSATAQARED